MNFNFIIEIHSTTNLNEFNFQTMNCWQIISSNFSIKDQNIIIFYVYSKIFKLLLFEENYLYVTE